MKAVELSPAARSRALRELAAGGEVDVLVVGGGVVGAGAALDAATRGLSVGLVEARDWAAGTSSRASKLIHGGLRYLEMLDFGLVHEALRERGLMVRRLAPHLVRPVPFLYPLSHRVWERPYVGAGVLLYDTMGAAGRASRGLPHHRHLTKRRALKVAPGLKPGALVGAVQYWDAQVDDARHTMSLVRTAASYGALVANRAKVVRYLRDGERVTGAVVADQETGAEIEVRARQVVAATGVWTDETQALADASSVRVRASKGVHLLVPRDRIDSSSGLILRTERSVLFVIPWGRHWIVGTTDTDWDLDKDHPAATAADIDYLLEHANRVLAEPLAKDDVEGVYAGLRPLLSGASDQTAKLSREHLVGTPVPGLVVIAGGKYTTYRVMAEDAVDEAVRGLDGAAVPASVTEDVPLVGADGYRALWNRRSALALAAGLPVRRVAQLLRRYGTLVDEVLDLIAADPSLAEPLPSGDGYLRAEVVYAATHEGARDVEDVLARRTRISIESRDRGTESAVVAASLMAPVLGWDAERTAREAATYVRLVEAEREAQEQPDDLAAANVWLRARKDPRAAGDAGRTGRPEKIA
ncbi:glycerol-3-phosphate dehydrogenase/oxidase [Actinomadura xylanilytica]|uniref:glycerol-3-phosphate dehydrogenase/oxidase n=1 Tax=Actinomadura xylanilytica TaxID=887459 RepID=UPI00255A7A1C|nr:glycerol-3-phosphate dehydrogenase/oxidase [Actinomadura xylanilytica]MDL4770822.1 glycerol-3-phosphate dehydrogenase/oxidase [Actinomadura xylanilytica]